MDEAKAAVVLRHIDHMPPLSPTIAKIIQVANSPTSSANDLNKVISLDPVLAAKVLKLVNSAYFGLNERVTSTVRAIIMLGLNTIKDLALSTAAMEAMAMKGKGALNLDDYWKHVLGVAVGAKLIARKININKNEVEDYFLAGLMHDIGKIVLNRLNPAEYMKALKGAEETNTLLADVESEIFGINHPEIGKMIAEKWSMTSGLIQALSLHHSPEEAAPEHTQLVMAVHVANVYVKMYEVGASGNPVIEYMTGPMWDKLGMPESGMDELSGFITEGVERAAVFMQAIK